MAWWWLATDPGEPLDGHRFASQGEAETWLGEAYPDLLDAGVRAVTLVEEDRTVYGPMSLEPDPR